MEIRTVGLITYHCPHLKTEQVVNRLLKTTVFGFRMYGLPFKARKQRKVLIQHRPDQTNAVAGQTIAQRHGIPYVICESDRDIDQQCDVYLILGAGILSAECVIGKRIINCHPGIIPASRGLDSFKWAIYERKPLGISLHYIDEQVDAGEVISVEETCVYRTDTLETLARRHYENEIDSIVKFAEYLASPINPFANIEAGEARMRMPLSAEQEVTQTFEQYTERYGQQ